MYKVVFLSALSDATRYDLSTLETSGAFPSFGFHYDYMRESCIIYSTDGFIPGKVSKTKYAGWMPKASRVLPFSPSDLERDFGASTEVIHGITFQSNDSNPRSPAIGIREAEVEATVCSIPESAAPAFGEFVGQQIAKGLFKIGYPSGLYFGNHNFKTFKSLVSSVRRFSSGFCSGIKSALGGDSVAVPNRRALLQYLSDALGGSVALDVLSVWLDAWLDSNMASPKVEDMREKDVQYCLVDARADFGVSVSSSRRSLPAVRRSSGRSPVGRRAVRSVGMSACRSAARAPDPMVVFSKDILAVAEPIIETLSFETERQFKGSGWYAWTFQSDTTKWVLNLKPQDNSTVHVSLTSYDDIFNFWDIDISVWKADVHISELEDLLLQLDEQIAEVDAENNDIASRHYSGINSSLPKYDILTRPSLGCTSSAARRPSRVVSATRSVRQSLNSDVDTAAVVAGVLDVAPSVFGRSGIDLKLDRSFDTGYLYWDFIYGDRRWSLTFIVQGDGSLDVTLYRDSIKATSVEGLSFDTLEDGLSVLVDYVLRFDDKVASSRRRLVRSHRHCPYGGSVPAPSPDVDRVMAMEDAFVEYLSTLGACDGDPDSDFDPVQLAVGVLVELEHSDDFDVAKEIAKDHLVEDCDYYGAFRDEAVERIDGGLGASADGGLEASGSVPALMGDYFVEVSLEGFEPTDVSEEVLSSGGRSKLGRLIVRSAVRMGDTYEYALGCLAGRFTARPLASGYNIVVDYDNTGAIRSGYMSSAEFDALMGVRKVPLSVKTWKLGSSLVRLNSSETAFELVEEDPSFDEIDLVDSLNSLFDGDNPDELLEEFVVVGILDARDLDTSEVAAELGEDIAEHFDGFTSAVSDDELVESAYLVRDGERALELLRQSKASDEKNAYAAAHFSQVGSFPNRSEWKSYLEGTGSAVDKVSVEKSYHDFVRFCSIDGVEPAPGDYFEIDLIGQAVVATSIKKEWHPQLKELFGDKSKQAFAYLSACDDTVKRPGEVVEGLASELGVEFSREQKDFLYKVFRSSGLFTELADKKVKDLGR